VECPGISVEDQWQEETITLPHGQFGKPGDFHPGEFSFLVAGVRRSPVAVHPEDKAQPVFTGTAEPGPIDGAAQRHLFALDAGFLPDLPAEAADYVFVRQHLPAETVVFVEMHVIRPGVAVHQERLRAAG